jgi:hypothetical protein
MTNDFVVHNFSYAETTQTSNLLDVGHSIIHAATSPRGWISVGGISPRNSTSSTSMSNSLARMKCVTGSFQYNGSTLLISVRRLPRILKEWGEPIGPDDDVYDLDDLCEFESTDFSSLCRVDSSSDESNRTRKHSFTNTEEPQLKRRKLDIYTLHDLIPQVRFFTRLVYPTNVVLMLFCSHTYTRRPRQVQVHLSTFRDIFQKGSLPSRLTRFHIRHPDSPVLPG